MLTAFLIFALSLSIVLNILFIYRFFKTNGEFWLDDRNPDDIKPVLRFDLDEWLKFNFVVIKVVKEPFKDKDSGDKERK